MIFDVEAVFIFPWAIQLEELGSFGAGRDDDLHRHPALGLVYAWRKGLLRWA